MYRSWAGRTPEGARLTEEATDETQRAEGDGPDSEDARRNEVFPGSRKSTSKLACSKCNRALVGEDPEKEGKRPSASKNELAFKVKEGQTGKPSNN